MFADLMACSGEDMRKPLSDEPPGLVLEMTDVGRGMLYFSQKQLQENITRALYDN